ncbi:adenylate cyclase [Chthoniobacter flavus Ellin428]|uniref:Adenylate cyclase n=1 Tax=Chthoniobacter flavus Ellin428 TaxID=497964 RepID=B4D4L9_9BACT|nr:CYTH domain-containing protein [Chthoniobacter flavus]EDY18472.1 adenylate cyclase [Chthoniobacter flavus Ellin428]TCO91065.1 CYTH domain-containing protein [Chthoniobacter flavus]
MPREIERKFLLKSDAWRGRVTGVTYRQGYLSTVPERTVRVRIAGDHAYLTVKGITTRHSRSEFEYPVPVADAEQMLALCEGPLVEKARYEIPHAGKTWQVDEYHGDNRGLILAEIELTSEDEKFELPEWIGDEVSGDARYYNSNLARNPFAAWAHS